MKKKVQRRLFVLIFILGLVAGILIPIDIIKSQFGKITGNSGEKIYDISKKFGQLDVDRGDYKYSVIEKNDFSSTLILRVDGTVNSLKITSKYFIYVNRGRADLIIGSKKSEISAGNVASISPESTIKIERVGDSPTELIIFSTGSFDGNMIS